MMKPLATKLTNLALLSWAACVWASEAETSATAGSGYGRDGTAEATARYEGDRGFARVRTRSGPVSLARGVAVGYDEHGLTLSTSHAIATRSGRALASNFNISIGRDGQVAVSRGRAVSQGRYHRSATAGGWASNRWGRSQSGSYASGRSSRDGSVEAQVDSRSYKVRRWGNSRRHESRWRR